MLNRLNPKEVKRVINEGILILKEVSRDRAGGNGNGAGDNTGVKMKAIDDYALCVANRKLSHKEKLSRIMRYCVVLLDLDFSSIY